MTWHFKGVPPYLDAQAKRLGISKVLVDRARSNPELHRCAVILGQCCAQYQAALKYRPALPPIDIRAMKGSFEQAQQEASKLHALAGAADAMLDEAYDAIGEPRPERPYVVMCDFDGRPPLTPPGPSSNGAAGPETNESRETMTTTASAAATTKGH